MTAIQPVNLNNDRKIWALHNKNKGLCAAGLAAGNTIIGCTKSLTNEETFLYKALTVIQAIISGIRNWLQYFLYSFKDDDLDFDRKNRPHAANIGEIACHIETKINPILLPATTLLNKEFQEAYNCISHYLNQMWWRIRPASEKINWKAFNSTFLETFKELFDPDIERRKKATKEIEKTIAPILGLSGAFFSGVFMPIKAFLKLSGTENKIIECLTSVGQLTQHTLYLFKFTLPNLWEAQKKNKSSSKILFGLGAAANMTNITTPIIDVLPLRNTVKRLLREVASGLTSIFFSTRRHVLGMETLEEIR